MAVFDVDDAPGKPVSENGFHGAGHHGTRFAGADDVYVVKPVQVAGNAADIQAVPLSHDMTPDRLRWIYGL